MPQDFSGFAEILHFQSDSRAIPEQFAAGAASESDPDSVSDPASEETGHFQSDVPGDPPPPLGPKRG